jgi:histidinol-phosphate aminotransferase
MKPRHSVQKMRPYSPPSSGRNDKIRLDFNENTLGCSPKVVEHLKNVLTQPLLSVYPEYEATRPAVAKFLNVAEDQLVLTNGTDEAIQVLVNTFVEPDEEVLLMTPSYAMYRFYAEVAGARVREIEYEPETLAFPADRFVANINNQTRLVMIANPNNPTGTAISIMHVEKLLRANANCGVLIDEAYFEFCGKTALPYIQRYPNLFVSRTFSKAFGMAAMRLGCVVSNAENVAAMRKAQSPYSVNLLAALAAPVALEDRAYVETYVKEVLSARDMLYSGLSELGIRHWRSEGNFILFHVGDKAPTVCAELRARGILVRDRSYELAGCVRVTVGTKDQTKRFLQGLKETLASA